MTRFVIDASVTLTYLLDQSEGAIYALRTMESLQRFGGVAPAIWASEVANALVVQERRGILSAELVDRVLSALRKLPVSVDSHADFLGDVTQLARRWHRSVYDAQYLELALRTGLPLATLDRGLSQAANAAGARLAEFS